MALGLISLKENTIVSAKGTNELVTSVTNTYLHEFTEVKLQNLISYVHQTVKRVPLASLQKQRQEAFEKQLIEFNEYQTNEEVVFLSKTTSCK